MTAPDDRRRVAFESSGYYRVREPRVPDARGAGGPAPALVALHGYAQPSAEMLELAVSVVPEDFLVVAPEGPSAFYRERVMDPAKRGVAHGWTADPRREDAEARNDALLLACLEDVARSRPLDPRRTVLLGYSQGVGVAAHFWTSHPERAVALVSLAGGLRAEARARLAALRGRRVLLVGGERDPHYTPEYERALASDMRERGLEVDTLLLPTGHGVARSAREPVAEWIRSVLAAPT